MQNELPKQLFYPWGEWPSTGSAIITPEQNISYEQLLTLTDTCARYLEACDVQQDDLLAIDLKAPWSWVLALAAMRYGITVYFATSREPEAGAFGRWLVTSNPSPNLLNRELAFDPNWFDKDLKPQFWKPAQSQTPKDKQPTQETKEHQAAALIWTSGTTGEPKAIELSRQRIEQRLATLDQHWSDGRPELCLMGLGSTGGFYAALAAFAHGSPLHLLTSSSPESVSASTTWGIRVLSGSPVQIRDLLAAGEAAGLTCESLEVVRSAGAAMPIRLVEALEAKLPGVRLETVYGSTEAGGIATRAAHGNTDEFNVGKPLPAVTLEIVDENHSPLPAGSPGQLRYQTPHMATEYWRNPAHTSRFFRDGFFYPGDRALINDAGELVIAGRESDIINLGGTKVDQAEIDQFLLRLPGVTDGAAFAVADDSGLPVLGAAWVGEADPKQIDQALRARFAGRHPTIIYKVESIARNDMGKVLRREIARAFVELAQSKTKPTQAGE